MKFLEGLRHHDLFPFDVVCEADPQVEKAVQAWPNHRALYCVGLFSRNAPDEVQLTRITAGDLDINRIASQTDSASFAGERMFPMDLGLVHREQPITVCFRAGDRRPPAQVPDVSVIPNLTSDGLSATLSLSVEQLEAQLRRLRPPKLRLCFVCVNLPFDDINELDDLRWCRAEIARLRQENQRMWDRALLTERAQAFARDNPGHAFLNSCSPGVGFPTVPGSSPFPGNAPEARTAAPSDAAADQAPTDPKPDPYA